MVEPQVSSEPLGSVPVPDLSDGFNRSQPSSPVPRLMVANPGQGFKFANFKHFMPMFKTCQFTSRRAFRVAWYRFIKDRTLQHVFHIVHIRIGV
ncbi:hypothetical protein NDU88_004160 [Pleurodeles waltl]|uniref:Uncharacterized protein n=1 Tax=Pleurodeles waltl TaxID=8319 RepID=A0AAV7PE78_PLEWA|nr:hypothetical protein NDU88_004160 [Pleurodeles waltl]